MGADDYVTKPYRMRELVARMRAVHAPQRHRATTGREPEPSVRRIDVGDVAPRPRRARGDARRREVALPLKEFELLHLLMANAGRVLTRDVLIDRVWGSDYVGDTKTLDVHVKRLRAKIEDDPANPTRIATIRGLGYKFERPKALSPVDPYDAGVNQRPSRTPTPHGVAVPTAGPHPRVHGGRRRRDVRRARRVVSCSA